MAPHVAGVTLRPLESADAPEIAGWGADAGFCRAADWRMGPTPPERRAFFERVIAAPPTGLLRLGVVHDGDLIGYVDLHGDEPDRRELGFLIGPRSRWGRGLGGLAAVAGLTHGFDVLGLGEIWAEALATNLASVRILQGLDMRETGRGDDGVFLGVATYYRRFAISAGAWTDHHRPLRA
jgi:RimJ/RimL family protein N-acetyltransferase